MKKNACLISALICSSAMFIQCHRNLAPVKVEGVADLKRISEKVFGVKPENISKEGTQLNLAGFHTTEMLVSMRTDSRTFFVQDDEYGSKKKNGIYQGDDAAVQDRFKEIFKGLEIPYSEVRQAVVMQENLQTAKIDQSTKNFQMNPIEKGAKVLKASRAIDSIPVFNSEVTLALTKNMTIGFLQLHWPLISEKTVAEAKSLAKVIKGNWKVPDVAQAKPELVEAGIIHSSAVAQVMDIKAVIRVVYASAGGDYGRKAVYYYDRNGRHIDLPREFEKPIQENLPPRKSQ